MDDQNPLPRLGVSFRNVQRQCWQTAEDHGFHKSRENLTTVQMTIQCLALIGEEVGEAISGARHNDWENCMEELADIMIRVWDLADELQRRDPMLTKLRDAITQKMEKNTTRAFMHGKEA